MRIGAKSFRRRGRELRSAAQLAGGCLVAVAVLAVAGCGSSKPSYCTDRTNLENSIKGLTSLNASSGISGLQAQLQKIQSDANSTINSAKGDFPNETSALKSSVTSLENAVKGVTSSPTPSQIASIATAASGVVTAVNNFENASKSKC
jgi:prophage DNA circulation protein